MPLITESVKKVQFNINELNTFNGTEILHGQVKYSAFRTGLKIHNTTKNNIRTITSECTTENSIHMFKADKYVGSLSIGKEGLTNHLYPCGYEDPRLFIWNNEVWVICYRRCKKLVKGFLHKIIIFKFNEPKKKFYLHFNKRNKIEKNWMPFDHNGDLYLIYSYSPFVILRANFTGKKIIYCDIVKVVDRKDGNIGLSSPPVTYDDQHLLCSAHVRGSTRGKPTRHNFFFLLDRYTLEPSPPTKVVSMLGKRIEFLTNIYQVTPELYNLILGVNDKHTSIVTISRSALGF